MARNVIGLIRPQKNLQWGNVKLLMEVIPRNVLNPSELPDKYGDNSLMTSQCSW